jgi:hypothetical protein
LIQFASWRAGCRQHVPVWHEATREPVKQGRLVLLGVTQEQHADRCRLFAQWKRFDWPILHDPIDLLEAPAVPIVVAIDEHGIVRAVSPRPETVAAEFLDRTFADDAPPGAPRSAGPPDPAALRRQAEASPTARAWRALGDTLTIWDGTQLVADAIDAYTRALDGAERSFEAKVTELTADIDNVLANSAGIDDHQHIDNALRDLFQLLAAEQDNLETVQQYRKERGI